MSYEDMVIRWASRPKPSAEDYDFYDESQD